jgi:uncharacterized membrane protein
MKVLWQPSWGFQALELVVWLVSSVGIVGALAFGKWLLAVVVGLVGLSLVLRVRKRLRQSRHRSPERTRT